MRLALLALALCAIPSHAQQEVSTTMPNWPDETGNVRQPGQPLRPATAPDPAFPLRVRLKLTDTHFSYLFGGFQGHGHLTVDNTRYNFHYDCPEPSAHATNSRPAGPKKASR